MLHFLKPPAPHRLQDWEDPALFRPDGRRNPPPSRSQLRPRRPQPSPRPPSRGAPPLSGGRHLDWGHASFTAVGSNRGENPHFGRGRAPQPVKNRHLNQQLRDFKARLSHWRLAAILSTGTGLQFPQRGGTGRLQARAMREREQRMKGCSQAVLHSLNRFGHRKNKSFLMTRVPAGVKHFVVIANSNIILTQVQQLFCFSCCSQYLVDELMLMSHHHKHNMRQPWIQVVYFFTLPNIMNASACPWAHMHLV